MIVQKTASSPGPFSKGEGESEGQPSPLGREGWGEFGYLTTDEKSWRMLQEKAIEMRQL